jgi:hypothetical protein
LAGRKKLHVIVCRRRHGVARKTVSPEKKVFVLDTKKRRKKAEKPQNKAKYLRSKNEKKKKG